MCYKKYIRKYLHNVKDDISELSKAEFCVVVMEQLLVNINIGEWQHVAGVFLRHKIRHQVPSLIMEWRNSETIKADSLHSVSY